MMKAARKLLHDDVAGVIDAEIEAIEATGRSLVFDDRYCVGKCPHQREQPLWAYPAVSFEGTHYLPRHTCPVCRTLALHYGDWLEACSVNKDTHMYRTWPNPDDAIKACSHSWPTD